MTRGFLVALVGADGSGKSTLTELVARDLPLPATSIYLGVDPPPGVPILPTTRWLRRRWASVDSPDARATGHTSDPAEVSGSPGGPGDDSSHPVRRTRRLREDVASVARVLNDTAEEYHQLRRATRAAAHGKVVLLDPHYYYDYYVHEIATRPSSRIDRIHGRWLASVLPRPSLAICLDAPAEVLYARQPEGTLEQRVTRRAEYLEMVGDVDLRVLDAERPLAQVAEDVTRLVMEHARRRASPATAPSGRTTGAPAGGRTVGTALVTDAELMSSVAVIRSLGRAGWTVVATSKDVRAPGLHSRYTSVPVVLDAPDMASHDEADQLLAAAAAHGVDVIIPVTDNTLLALAPVRHRLPPGCTLATADPEALHATMDKAATLELAAKLGVPLPDVAHVTTVSEALAAVGPLGWPVVVKPRFSRVPLPGGEFARCSTSYAFDAAELAAQVAAQPPGSSVLLQRYHPGEAYSVCLLTVDGRPHAAFSHHRLREVPPSGGVSALRESVALDPVLDDYARRLLRELRWTGVAMVEFKVDEGRPLLMEINGRIWGSLPLATRAGLDFPRKLAELFLDGVPRDPDPDPDPDQVDSDYRIGVRSRRLGLELDWIEAVLRRREQPPVGPPVPRWEAVKAVGQLIRPSYGYDGVAWDDPRPAWTDLVITGRELVDRARTLRRRAGPGSSSAGSTTTPPL